MTLIVEAGQTLAQASSQAGTFTMTGRAAYAEPSMAKSRETKQYKAGIGWEKWCRPGMQDRQVCLSATLRYGIPYSIVVRTY